MQMKLELVPIPVTDVDRAKAFYVDRLGFVEDVDVRPAPGVRIVQLTPPGSACSVSLTEGLEQMKMTPGSAHGIHLVVNDITAARRELADNEVAISEVTVVGGGVSYAWFEDPDGNTLTLQEMAWRTGAAF